MLRNRKFMKGYSHCKEWKVLPKNQTMQVQKCSEFYIWQKSGDYWNSKKKALVEKKNTENFWFNYLEIQKRWRYKQFIVTFRLLFNDTETASWLQFALCNVVFALRFSFLFCIITVVVCLLICFLHSTWKLWVIVSHQTLLQWSIIPILGYVITEKVT